MHVLRNMVSMAKSPEEIKEEYSGVLKLPDGLVYPYGLCICLTDKELEKLDLTDEEVEVGDYIHLFAFAKVTSISKNDTASSKTTRVELQITDLSSEDESNENQKQDKREDRFRPGLGQYD